VLIRSGKITWRRRRQVLAMLFLFGFGLVLSSWLTDPIQNAVVFQTSQLKEGRSENGVAWQIHTGYCRFSGTDPLWLVYSRAPGNWFYDVSFAATGRPRPHNVVGSYKGFDVQLMGSPGKVAVQYNGRGNLQRSYRYVQGAEVSEARVATPPRSATSHSPSADAKIAEQKIAAKAAPTEKPSVESSNSPTTERLPPFRTITTGSTDDARNQPHTVPGSRLRG
jgi:hypothetical protein